MSDSAKAILQARTLNLSEQEMLEGITKQAARVRDVHQQMQDQLLSDLNPLTIHRIHNQDGFRAFLLVPKQD